MAAPPLLHFIISLRLPFRRLTRRARVRTLADVGTSPLHGLFSMNRLSNQILALAFVMACQVAGAAREPAHVPEKFGAANHRLGQPKDLNGYFPFTPPVSRKAWDARRKELREQILVATGLWPMPDRGPVYPVIHGKIDRDEYTIEKVFFASYPGALRLWQSLPPQREARKESRRALPPWTLAQWPLL